MNMDSLGKLDNYCGSHTLFVCIENQQKGTVLFYQLFPGAEAAKEREHRFVLGTHSFSKCHLSQKEYGHIDRRHLPEVATTSYVLS